MEGLSISNRLRGLLAEFGIVVAKSDHALRVALADLDQQIALPPEMRELLRELSAHWAQVRMDERCVRLRAIIGIGAITADAAIATLGDAKAFRNGRQVSA